MEGLIHQLKRSGDFNGALQRAGHRAAVRVDAVQAFNGFALGFRRPKLIVRVDMADDQYTPIRPNFAGNLRSQLAVAGINLARFQRTAKSAGQSAACSRYHIIQRGCAR